MPRLTRTAIADLLDRHQLSPSHALGQNFLCEPSLVDKIVRLADVAPGDRVVEMGPGLGSLTVGLANAGAEVLAVEIDQYIIPALNDVVTDPDYVDHDAGAVTVVNADAQTLDWSDALGDHDWKVVANLPYNVATPLVLDLLASQPRLRSFLVMVQKEVGDRLAAEPGSKVTGIPSILTAYWGSARVVGQVPATVFLPQPKVESVLVHIERSDQPRLDVDFARFSRLVRAGYGQRRKMVRRSLSDYLTEEQIEAAGVAPTERSERLDLEAWGCLTKAAFPEVVTPWLLS